MEERAHRNHLSLQADQILQIEYDHEDPPMGGDRKIVTTTVGKFFYRKQFNQWVLIEPTPEK
jgi:hypothetical protein